jgi:uncharacterized protein
VLTRISGSVGLSSKDLQQKWSISHLKGSFNWSYPLISTHILEELKRNLIEKFEFTQKEAKRLIFRIAEDADLYEPYGSVHVIAEKHADNLVLETAVLGKARYLVTGDRKHLLPLKVFRNVKILEASQFLSLF